MWSWLRSGASTEGPLALYLLGRMGLGLLLMLAALAGSRMGLSWPILNPDVLLAVGLITFGLWALSVVGLPRHGGQGAFIWAQFILDATLATVLIQGSSGPPSGLFFVYALNIVGSAFLLPSSQVMLVACMDVAFFVTSTVLVTFGYISLPWRMSTWELSYEVVLRVLALVLIGLLSRMLPERLQAVRREQSVVLDEVPAGVLRVSPQSRVVDQNRAARLLLGEVIGQDLHVVLAVEGDRWEQDVKRGDQALRLLCTRAPLATGGSLVLIEDVTRVRRMEMDLAREERLADVGRLTAALAHEIRNPLASVSGAAQLLAERRPDPLADIVVREVRRINDLVGELLDHARPLKVDLAPADPSGILSEVMQTFQADPRYRDRVEVVLSLSALPAVLLDPGRFRQVVLNLLLNAAQAIPEQGRVTITASWQQGVLHLQVADTGLGIAPDVLARVFDPFFTTRSGGSGLGLATVRRIVEAHGGSVEVSSVQGQGTTFSLTFRARALASEGRLAG